MKDFTLTTYKDLLISLKNEKYSFLTFREFLESPIDKCIILRHDVDLSPENALKIAIIENEMGIRSTFYFQISPRIYKIDIVKRISELGHEIGYHYKEIETISKNKSWNFNYNKNLDLITNLAYEKFEQNLEKIRKDIKIDTICMHGSPRFKLDNRLVWTKYDYKKLGILGEPYYDIDWNNVGYLTDSGRRWNGEAFIVRDKVEAKFKSNFKSTFDIIKSIDSLPDQIMITTHPQRWSNNILSWIKEYVVQNIKNLIKKNIYVEKSSSEIKLKPEVEKMKLLFHLGHPAHFHLFNNVIKHFFNNGNKVYILIKKKDILENLLIESKIPYHNILPEGRRNSILGIALGQFKQDFALYRFIKNHEIDLMLGTSVSIAHIGKIFNIPSIVFNEDDVSVVPFFSYLTYPFTELILSPMVCNNKHWKNKTLFYNSYHELAYLHPNNFTPNKKIIEKYINPNKTYFIMRFSGLDAHHDKGIEGLNLILKKKIIKILSPYGQIVINSERELIPEFEKYRLNIDTLDMHHLLAYTKIYIGDSQTMAAEAGVLGTPFIRFNDFVNRIGYLNELENKYKLGYGFRTNQSEELLIKLQELLDATNLSKEWQTKRQLMLKDKIDLNLFTIELLDHIQNNDLFDSLTTLTSSKSGFKITGEK